MDHRPHRRQPLTQVAGHDALNLLMGAANMPATAGVEPHIIVRMKSGSTQNESHTANIVNHRRLMRRVNLMLQSSHVNIDEIGL